MVEMEIFDTAHETHVGLMENDGPLKGRTVQGLTLDTVADYRIDRVGTDFEGDRTTKTLGAVLRRERCVVCVWGCVLPILLLCHDGPEHTTCCGPEPLPARVRGHHLVE
jgi:hypothetical protein